MNRISEKARRLTSQRGLEGRIDIDRAARQFGFTIDERINRAREITVGHWISVAASMGHRESRWAIAHGIGHIVLHKREANHVRLQLRGHATDQYEREAELFAYSITRVLYGIEILMDG